MATVRELREYLNHLNPEAQVIISSDAEGNHYSPWAGDHAEGWYTPESTWSGSFTDELFDHNDEPREPNDDDVVAIVLWPVN